MGHEEKDKSMNKIKLKGDHIHDYTHTHIHIKTDTFSFYDKNGFLIQWKVYLVCELCAVGLQQEKLHVTKLTV